MKPGVERKKLAWLLWGASLLFFILGFQYPLLQSGIEIGPFTIRKENIYLSTSFRYFFDKGEVFIGLLLLFFTIIFPVLKYGFLLLTLLGRSFPRHAAVATLLELINKWSMLDVFVVAVLILNMKFGSGIIVSRLQGGTTLFAVSVLLLMSCSFVTRKIMAAKEAGTQQNFGM